MWVQVSHFGVFALKSNLFQHSLFAGLQQAVQAAQDEHRQDDIAVLAADKDIAQTVVSNRPDEGNNLVMSGVVHESLGSCVFV